MGPLMCRIPQLVPDLANHQCIMSKSEINATIGWASASAEDPFPMDIKPRDPEIRVGVYRESLDLS